MLRIPAAMRIELNDTYRSNAMVDLGYYYFRVVDESALTERSHRRSGAWAAWLPCVTGILEFTAALFSVIWFCLRFWEKYI